MTKTEKYFKEIQKIAYLSKDCYEFIEKIDLFLVNQEILKRNKISKLSDKVKIYFIEYINNNLEYEFTNQNEENNIFLFLYYKINQVCLKLKYITTDDIIQTVLQDKLDKINSIIIENYSIKKLRVKELESEISNLKRGWL